MRRPPLAILVALLAAGCGGGGRSTAIEAKGRLAVRFAWPAPAGRVIPAAAQSIRVQVLQNSTVTNEAILTPGAPNASFTEVPTGTVTVKAVAYPTAGGTGTAMASAQTTQTILASGTASVTLTMASLIDHIAITPNTLSISIGATQQLVVTAYDASNAVVLTDPSEIQWTKSGLFVNVSSTGLVQALSLGVGSVTATETLSGKSATLPISVHV